MLVYEEPIDWDYFYNKIIIVALSSNCVSMKMWFKGVLLFFSHLVFEVDMIDMLFEFEDVIF